MRNTVLKVFFSLLLVLFVVSCNEPDPTIPVAGVYLSKPSLEMAVGNKEELTATVTPAEATNKKVTWTTSDANVAEIIRDEGGVDFKSLLRPLERPLSRSRPRMVERQPPVQSP